MGSAHDEDPNVFHFSHPHPLQCTTLPSAPNILSCFGCNIKINSADDYYQCKTCAFSLHHVCYNMPLITNHPSHPAHHLLLLPLPSTKPTLNCVACGHHVTAFSYHCAQCAIFFHALCLALPLSLAITCHPHKIKLEFSPPYEFFCDLCNQPSNYNHRWLYRCNMCEFDTHVACALENLEPRLFQSPSFSRSSPLLRQLTRHQVEHTKFSASLGDSFKGYEYGIMSLVAEQIGGGPRENFYSKTAGWNKRLYSSPKKNLNRAESERMKNAQLELLGKELNPDELLSKLEERTPLRDKWTPLSDHSPFSYQNSDSYFSIDLAKSYSTHSGRSQVQKDGGSDQITRAATNYESNCGQREEPSVPVNNKRNADVLIKEGRTSDVGKSDRRVMMKNANESHAKRSVQDKTISETVSSN
ncbi:hypothetical protein LR48_Vigan03g222900 [Vigna angularis]|uniref:DC1 domain-containing protein n=1 Tax=Phaseolus angularis TaxID=3914 RepID=A0A0L9U856_PHAAN|nr:uncharacterized protein LOC108326775 isoform X1 [Vigna angularis]KAG2405718.1 uncharacterized protein HKW66_Vig0049730 [Vigna angularis]KOM38847.1 hypothetical protein LR48_Vigan03g222900 [Vigna angularis]